LDLNPILVHPSGVTVVDARARVAPVERPSLPGALSERGRRGRWGDRHTRLRL